MSYARYLLVIASAIMLIGGILLIIASIYVFLVNSSYAYGALQGLLLIIFMMMIGGFEVAASQAVFKVEQGIWRNAVLLTALSALLKVFTALTAFSVYDQMRTKDGLVTDMAWACLIMAAAEAVAFVLLLALRHAFDPTEEEVMAAMKKIGGKTVKTVSECPKCHEIVEKDWVQCPQCGTRLPRFCANCGANLPSIADKCPSCGNVIERPQATRDMILAFKALSEEEARPETRSMRYGRLAEAYLKGGETEKALESYDKAIEYTEFDRKRTNFMVKMANVLESEGRVEEAMQTLDSALRIDPSDEAGAEAMKGAIRARSTARAAKEAYEKGDKAAALGLADESLASDPRDFNDVGWIKAEELLAKAEEMIRNKAPSEETFKVLDEAAKLDPYNRTGVAEMRTRYLPKEKRSKKGS